MTAPTNLDTIPKNLFGNQTPRTPRSLTPRSLSSSPRSLSSTPITSINTAAKLALTTTQAEPGLPLEVKAKFINPDENKQKKIDRYEIRYPFLRVMLKEIEAFNRCQESFLKWEGCLFFRDLRETLGLTKGDRSVFGKAKNIQDALEIYQKDLMSSLPLDNTPIQIFMGMLRKLEPKCSTVCLNILTSFSDLKNTSYPIDILETDLLKSSTAQQTSQELEIFNKALMNFALVCHDKFQGEDAIFEKARQEFQEERKFALRAIIHLLKNLYTLTNLTLNEKQQNEHASLLEEIRELYEEENLIPIPFHSVGQFLDALALNQKGKSPSEPNSRETTPRFPTSQSLPDLIFESRVRAQSNPIRTSPILKRNYDVKLSPKGKRKQESPLQKFAHHVQKIKIPQLPLNNFFHVSKSEEASPKTPSPKVTFELPTLKSDWAKHLELMREVLQTEKCSIGEGKQGELVTVNSKLDEKAIRILLKHVENSIDPLLNQQDSHQQHNLLNEVLSLLANHKIFRSLSEENQHLYDLYLKVQVKVLYGGILHTCEQFHHFSQNFFDLLFEKEVPENFSVDVYGEEINVSMWFDPIYQHSSSMFSALTFLKSPAERFRTRVTEYHLKIRQYHLQLETLIQYFTTISKAREHFRSESGQFLNDSEFIVELVKKIGMGDLSVYVNEISADTRIPDLIDRIINLENQVRNFTIHKNPPLKFLLTEFSDEMKEIQNQNHRWGQVIMGVFSYLTENSPEATLCEKEINTLLKSPYVQVQTVLDLFKKL
jgi:hypothetical protein